jgi:hypothetical protein
MAEMMRADVRHGPNDLRYEAVPKPHARPGQAVTRMTLTTVCGSNIHAMHPPAATCRTAAWPGHGPRNYRCTRRAERWSKRLCRWRAGHRVVPYPVQGDESTGGES